MFNEVKDLEKLSPKKLYSDDGADKVMAIIELITNPKKAQEQLETVRQILEDNEKILEEIKQGNDIKVMHQKASELLEKAEEKIKESDVRLKYSKQQADELLKEAREEEQNVKKAAHRYATNVKEKSKKLDDQDIKQAALLDSLEKKEKQLKAKLKAAAASKREYEEKLKELKSRFEDL